MNLPLETRMTDAIDALNAMQGAKGAISVISREAIRTRLARLIAVMERDDSDDAIHNADTIHRAVDCLHANK